MAESTHAFTVTIVHSDLLPVGWTGNYALLFEFWRLSLPQTESYMGPLDLLPSSAPHHHNDYDLGSPVPAYQLDQCLIEGVLF